jgi:undecaprenyl pyrophosphate phosphatase UppP
VLVQVSAGGVSRESPAVPLRLVFLICLSFKWSGIFYQLFLGKEKTMLMLFVLFVVAVFSGLITRLFKTAIKDRGTDSGLGFMLGGGFATILASLFAIGFFCYFGAQGAFWLFFWRCTIAAVVAMFLGWYL